MQNTIVTTIIYSRSGGYGPVHNILSYLLSSRREKWLEKKYYYHYYYSDLTSKSNEAVTVGYAVGHNDEPFMYLLST